MKLDQQSRRKTLRAYCPNLYTVHSPVSFARQKKNNILKKIKHCPPRSKGKETLNPWIVLTSAKLSTIFLCAVRLEIYRCCFENSANFSIINHFLKIYSYAVLYSFHTWKSRIVVHLWRFLDLICPRKNFRNFRNLTQNLFKLHQNFRRFNLSEFNLFFFQQGTNAKEIFQTSSKY